MRMRRHEDEVYQEVEVAGWLPKESMRLLMRMRLRRRDLATWRGGGVERWRVETRRRGQSDGKAIIGGPANYRNIPFGTESETNVRHDTEGARALIVDGMWVAVPGRRVLRAASRGHDEFHGSSRF